MKSKSIGSLIVLAILAPSCGSGGGGTPKAPITVKWQTQQRIPTSSDLRSVIFANPNQGIIGGKDGTIFRTDDGGLTWTQQEFLPSNRGGDIVTVSAYGTTIIAAGTDAALPTKGRLWDGRNSTSWVTADATATADAYTDIHVSDPGSGNVPGSWWALRGVDGKVDYQFGTSSSTFDTELLAPPAPPVHVPPTHPIDWLEANGINYVGVTGFGFVCGREAAYAGYPADPVAPSAYPADTGHGAQGMIIRTDNFGNTWSRLAISPPTNNVYRFRRFYVTTAANGVMRAYVCGDATNTGGGLVMVTSITVPDQMDAVAGAGVPAGAPSFRALSFPINDQAGWVVGDGGTIYRITATVTTNPGPPVSYTYNYTWTNQSPGAGVTTANLYSISMANNDVGYAVGDGGVILKTTNASTTGTWTKISRGTAGISFNAAMFTDDGVRGLAVGNGGNLFRTLDGGNTWTSMASTTGNNLLGVCVSRFGTGFAYACGANGTVLKNTDVWGVGAWSGAGMTGLTGTDIYRAILFPLDDVHGAVVGETNTAAPRLLRTLDGTAWGAATFTPPSAGYYSLTSSYSGGAMYASSGTNGIVSTSTDGGSTWTNISPGPGALTLFSVQSPEGGFGRAYVGASDGQVYRLLPGTPSWQPSAVRSWTATNAVSLGFQGDALGVAVTGDGKLHYTVDGAVNWTLSPAHTKDPMKFVWMSPSVAGLGYAVGSDGTILKTLTGGQ